MTRRCRGTDLYLGGDEERSDANELQVVFVDVLLGQHEAVEVVLCEVGGLPVEAVHLAHLHGGVTPAQSRSREHPSQK